MKLCTRRHPALFDGTEALKKTALLLASTALIGFAALPAQAQTFNEIMEDLGVKSREKHKMDFSERAPLVIPPSLDQLPPPEDASALAAANPNWPTDPEVKSQLEQEERDRKEKANSRLNGPLDSHEIYQIRAREREVGSNYDPSGAGSYDPNYQQRVLTPDELQEVRRRNEANAGTAVPQAYVEPARARLTDPPTGYRTPSAAQPFGPGENEKKKTNFFSKLNPFK